MNNSRGKNKPARNDPTPTHTRKNSNTHIPEQKGIDLWRTDGRGARARLCSRTKMKMTSTLATEAATSSKAHSIQTKIAQIWRIREERNKLCNQETKTKFPLK
jgi:hypothetical protein